MRGGKIADMSAVLDMGLPIMAELGPPQPDTIGQFHDAALRGPQDLAKEIVVLGCANVAGPATRPVGEVPVAVPGPEFVHGDSGGPSKRRTSWRAGRPAVGRVTVGETGWIAMLPAARLVLIARDDGESSPMSELP